MRKVLCALTINPQYIQFAIPELKSILKPLPIPLKILLQQEILQINKQEIFNINYKSFKNFPFITICVPDYQIHKKYFQNACKKAVMIHKMILLISSGNTYDEIIKNRDLDFIKQNCQNNEQEVVCQFFSRNRCLQRQDQIKRIHRILQQFDIRGKVTFKNPKIRYQLIQQHQRFQFHHKTPLESTIKKIFFGIQLCSNKIATAKFNNLFQLNKRIYLGPTSADNDLAFMMCNQALIKQGSIIIDPFVGTGGLLIPPASMGAITFGSDLDTRVLNGYSVGRINKKSPFYKIQKKLQIFTPKILLNFQQYQLAYPNIIRIDSTKLAFRQGFQFDAIITDPPYGIRAMSRTVTAKNQNNSEQQSLQSQEQAQKKQLTQQQKQQKAKRRQKRKLLKQKKRQRKLLQSEEQKNFKLDVMKKMNKERTQQWQKYDKGKIQNTQRQKIFYGLLNFARKYLRKQGRLVFLYPIYQQEEYLGIKSLPPYEDFKVIDLSENKMSKGNSRILVTMQKI